MSITVTVQPDAHTTVEVADGPTDVPALIIGAGPVAVVMEPDSVPGGMEAAIEFARLLAQGVTAWEQVCSGRLVMADQVEQRPVRTGHRGGYLS